MSDSLHALIERINQKAIWDTEPVFCFTSDIDWASEYVLESFFTALSQYGLAITAFVTHQSDCIEHLYQDGGLDRGIHPNFLPGSSHGNSYTEVIDACLQYAPESECFRSHRLFDVTDITHLLKERYGFKYVSNLGTILQTHIRPVLHESGLLHYPIFFEDGTHLWNKLDLNVQRYAKQLDAPGIKIISIHPMNYVFNTPSITYMRSIKDSMSREDYNTMLRQYVVERRNTESEGIADTVNGLIRYVREKNYRIMSLKEIYRETIRGL